MKKGYLMLSSGSNPIGRLDLVLYDETTPKTVENFCHFLSAPTTKGYLQSRFHRVIKGFMAQGGDFLNGDGSGSTSIYGPQFSDENFTHSHDQPGRLSMANSGKDTNGCQFFITFRATPHLDGKHVVFGHVDLSTPKSRAVLKAMENVATASNDRPVLPVTIVDCGIVEENPAEDDNHIGVAEEASISLGQNPADDENEMDGPEVEPEELEEDQPTTKVEALKRRMRKLKMKMNQARHLNKQEVLKEGERLGSVEGAEKTRKRQQLQDKKLNETEWKARNAKALEVAKAHGLEGKHLVEQADSSIKKAYRKAENVKANRFEMKDYHNPEGQHRNYQRNLKSLPFVAAPLTVTGDEAVATFNPIVDQADEARDREGARHLANEMKRLIEKKKKKRQREVEFEQEDVSYINQRNKRFNQKIARNYDKHTAEIRQNLERGTAL